MSDIFDEIPTEEEIEESLPPREYEKLPIARGIVYYRNRFLLIDDMKTHEFPDSRWDPRKEVFVPTGTECLKYILSMGDPDAVKYNEAIDAREDLSESEREALKEPEKFTIFEKKGQHIYITPRLDAILTLFEGEKIRAEQGEDFESRFPAKVAFWKGPAKNSRISIKSHSWLREQHKLFETSNGEDGIPPLSVTRQPFYKPKEAKWDQ